MVNPRVEKIYQWDHEKGEIHVQTDSFEPGQEVEVSGYVTQASGAYAAFNVTMRIPLDANPTAKLNVQLPYMDLQEGEDVTVVTRVAEVWPTTLGQDNARKISKELRGVWTAKDPPGKEPGGPAAPRGKR
jgi:hypothetical protein